MGNFSNIGATLLDVQQGMEYQKGIQRKDADWTRGQKRADMQDQVAQYGLEDLQRKRSDESGNREAFKAGGLDAVQAEAKKRGDQSSHQKAAADRIAELTNSINQRELEAKQIMQPDALKLAKDNLAGAVARAPAQNQMQNAQVQSQLRDLTEKQSLDMVMLAKYDKKSAIDAYNKSSLVEAGKEATDISYDGPKQAWVLTYKDGSTYDMPLQQIQALHQKHYPPQYKTLNKGDSLVSTSRTGKPEIMLTAPDKDVPGKFTETKDGGILDTRTGAVKPGPGGPRPANPASRNAAIAKVIDIVKTAKGGSLSMGLADADAQKVFAPIIARAGELVDKGMAPEAAANTVLAEFERAGNPALKDATESAKKAPPMSWQDIAKQPFPTPRDAKPAAPSLGGSVMNGYGLDSVNPEVPSVFP